MYSIFLQVARCHSSAHHLNPCQASLGGSVFIVQFNQFSMRSSFINCRCASNEMVAMPTFLKYSSPETVSSVRCIIVGVIVIRPLNARGDSHLYATQCDHANKQIWGWHIAIHEQMAHHNACVMMTLSFYH